MLDALYASRVTKHERVFIADEGGLFACNAFFPRSGLFGDEVQGYALVAIIFRRLRRPTRGVSSHTRETTDDNTIKQTSRRTLKRACTHIYTLALLTRKNISIAGYIDGKIRDRPGRVVTREMPREAIDVRFHPFAPPASLILRFSGRQPSILKISIS